MYIIKNAMRNVSRNRGRNILIGIIIFIIVLSSCVGLSIMGAADKAKTSSLDTMTISAQISVDRQAMMSGGEDGEAPDPEAMRERLQSTESLSLSELKSYAQAEAATDFYYSSSLSLNGSEELEAVSTSVQSESSDNGSSSEGERTDTGMMPGGDMPSGEMSGGGSMPGFVRGGMGTQGDFTVVGYGKEEAMTDFISGSSSITEGSFFDFNESDMNCVISDELATYNDLAVGDEITVENPNNEGETYILTVSGIYHNEQSSSNGEGMMGGFNPGNDAANRIYLSYPSVESIISTSASTATTSTDETTGLETTTALPEQVSGTYIFKDLDAYYAFEEQVRELGLSEDYQVTSTDVSSYENSLIPLENLSKMTSYFLIVVLGIGAVVLIVINMFAVRERKYEIGVLTAIGMKKGKVALSFLLETLLVTICAMVIGTGLGVALSGPVSNSLLKQQIESMSEQESQQEAAFGRPGGEMMNGQRGEAGAPGESSYLDEVDASLNFTVLAQLIGIGLLLGIVAGMVAIVFILRYNPLDILVNRD
ncbi:putative ABC transport system permease protein [Lachnospiraceae bacterium PF1-22]|uniref:ABC transporter permease n=1 Tax=Ohessyouella blattaphilus TaxID=2949333 RepID=UPI003E29F692